MPEYPVPPPPPGSSQPLPLKPSVASRYKRRRRPSWGEYALAGLVLLVIAAILSWALAAYIDGSDTRSELPRSQRDDPDLELVRAWLRENTDGKWKEVEWWPVRSPDPEDPNYRVCRLKWYEYVYDEYTGEWLDEGVRQDEIFQIRDGKAELHWWTGYMRSNWQWGWSTDRCWEHINRDRGSQAKHPFQTYVETMKDGDFDR